MKKEKGSWAKIGLLTTLVSSGAGLLYGWQLVQEENQARYKKAMDFSFEKEYWGYLHHPGYPEWLEGGYHRPDVKRAKFLNGYPNMILVVVARGAFASGTLWALKTPNL
jgi:hypothetical protein